MQKVPFVWEHQYGYREHADMNWIEKNLKFVDLLYDDGLST